MEAIKQQLQGSHGIGYYSSTMHAPMFVCNLIMRGNENVDEQAATVLKSPCTLNLVPLSFLFNLSPTS
jgi:hypothetical protein